MGIDKLRYFAAVAETKNVRKAADLVGITPGAMSKAIATLQNELGVVLLRPEGRGIEITEAGLQVYRQSASLLIGYQNFLEGLKDTRKSTLSHLRLGTFEVFSSYFLSSFLSKELPQYDVSLLELTPGQMEAAVLDHVIDFALTYLPSPDPRLDFVEVGQFEMAIWGNEKWLKQDFADWPFAVPMTAVQIHSLEHSSLDMWPQKQKVRRIKYKFELLETALQTSRLGHSVLHCPGFIVKIHNQQVRRDLQLTKLPYPSPHKKAKPVKVFLIAKKGNPSISLIEGKLAKFLRSLR